jgi:hypothetical protein
MTPPLSMNLRTSPAHRLGDRHLENILMDTNTGDVVHVDFNCLFEKVSPVTAKPTIKLTFSNRVFN